MISTEYLNKIFTKHGGSWDAFYKTYPKAAGFWNISRPGYNSTHDEAMLYVGHQCGSLCGTGHLYFLKKKMATGKYRASRCFGFLRTYSSSL
jgi:hypothetical protein